MMCEGYLIVILNNGQLGEQLNIPAMNDWNHYLITKWSFICFENHKKWPLYILNKLNHGLAFIRVSPVINFKYEI